METLGVLAVSDSVTFGQWRYERRQRRLLRRDDAADWVAVPLGSRAADILAALLREPGALITKDALMDTVWPGVTVEANNLTVQVAALRRVLDEGVAGPSCIETVPGRGYRLLCRIDDADRPPVPADDAAEIAPVVPRPFPAGRHRIGGGILAATLLAATGYLVWPGRASAPPRMSALVMPFENLGGADDAKIAAALTDDVKAGLSMQSPVRIVNGKAPQSLDGQRGPVEAIGRKLGARYVITGSERRLDDVLRVNAQVVATETGAVLWTDRFDVSLADPAAGQEQAGSRVQLGIIRALVPLEAARGQSERPDGPDAFDLFLRAYALSMVPPTPSRSAESRALLERALVLKPSSLIFRLALVNTMLDAEDEYPHGRKTVFERAATLLAQARASDPGFWLGDFAQLHFASWQESRHCPEVVDLAEQFIKRYPTINAAGDVRRWLGSCLSLLGRADAAVAVMQQALSFDPGPHQSHDYRNLQFALLLLGRYDESIQAGERALARNPNDATYELARLNDRLAAAYALTGRLDDAKRKLAEGTRLQPFATLRRVYVPEHANPVFAAQQARVAEGLRLAGLRDHAEEDADFGVVPDQRLHQEYGGPTPLTLPGAETIRTEALVRLLAERHPIVIDAMNCFSGPSLPGAIGLRYVGAGGELTDLAQDRLRTTMVDLTAGKRDVPIVAVGWNSENFDGRNLALRLVTLGYTHVSWYRGGREAWETHTLPEQELTPRPW